MGKHQHNRGGPGRSGPPRRARRRRSAKRRALQSASLHAQQVATRTTEIPPPAPRPKTLQKFRRWLVGLSLGAIALLTIVGIGAYLLARATPAWWRTVDRENPVSIQSAQDLQNALGTQFTAVRPAATDLRPDEPWRSDIWRFALEVDDANAWLNINLPQWIESDPDLPAWPDAIESIQVAFRRGLFFVGVQLDRGDGLSQYLAAAIHPEIRANGSLWIPADRIYIGRLPIPPDTVLAQAQARVDRILPDELTENGRALLSVFRGENPLAQQPVIRLGDGRQVRLLDIQSWQQKLIVSCQTERRDDAQSGHSEP